MMNRKTKLLFIVCCYWLITGAACDTFLKAEGTITLKEPLSEQYAGKKLVGVWAIEAKKQSANTAMPGGELCESLGVDCSVVMQSIDVSYVLQGEDQTPTLNPEARDAIVKGQNSYPFKLGNIYGPGEKSRFARNYIGAFIDIDNNGQWEMIEPFGWATANPIPRRCVVRQTADDPNCNVLTIPIE